MCVFLCLISVRIYAWTCKWAHECFLLLEPCHSYSVHNLWERMKEKAVCFFLYYVWNKNMRRWIFRRYWLAEKSCRCVTLCIRKFMNVFSFKYSIGSLFIKAPLPREHKRLFCFMFCLWSMCVRPSEQVWCIRTYSVN